MGINEAQNPDPLRPREGNKSWNKKTTRVAELAAIMVEQINKEIGTLPGIMLKCVGKHGSNKFYA